MNRKSLVLRGSAYLGLYREVVWLIGDGRSGTTWVSSLINHRQQYREMFEPFHPRVFGDVQTFQPNMYIRPGDAREGFREIAAQVFSGKLTHDRVDRDTRPALYRGLLVKDIFANLFAYWARLRFPDVKVILLLRNPFEVALSKLRKRKWFWTTDPLDLFNQRDLQDDLLRPFEALIRSVSARNDYVQNQILIWSILNWVPLVQFRPGEMHVIFYEHMVADPDGEVAQVMKHVRPHDSAPSLTIPDELVRKPSRVTAADSPVRSGASLTESWKSALQPAEIEAGFEILRHFGLDGLYPLDAMPDRNHLAHVRRLP